MKRLIALGALLLSSSVFAQCETGKQFIWYELASLESIENQADVADRMVSTKRVEDKTYIIYANRNEKILDIVVRYDNVFLKLDKNNCDPYVLNEYAISATDGKLYLGIEKK